MKSSDTHSDDFKNVIHNQYTAQTLCNYHKKSEIDQANDIGKGKVRVGGMVSIDDE